MKCETEWPLLFIGNAQGRLLAYFLSPDRNVVSVPMNFIRALRAGGPIDAEVVRVTGDLLQIVRGGYVDFTIPAGLLLQIAHPKGPLESLDPLGLDHPVGPGCHLSFPNGNENGNVNEDQHSEGA